MLAPNLQMTSYRSPDRPWDLKIRVRMSLKAQLEDVVRLWVAVGEALGDDVEQIDLNYVIREVLESGVDAAFAKFGGRPKTEEAWKEVLATVKKSIEKPKK